MFCMNNVIDQAMSEVWPFERWSRRLLAVYHKMSGCWALAEVGFLARF